MPKMSDTMEEGVIQAWHKKVGDKVSEGDILAEIETDKATMELESYFEGTLLHIGVEEGDTVPVDAVIAIVGKEGENVDDILKEEKAGAKKEKAEEAPAGEEAKQPEETGAKVEPAPEDQPDDDERIKASPLAKKMAEEKGIALRDIKGSGDGGRIVKRDIEQYSQEVPKQKTAAATAGTEEGYQDVKVSQMRKTIARRLAESKFTAPHFYLTMEINMDSAMEARQRINEMLDFKISFNDMIIKAAAVALKKHPEVNASWMGDHIRQFQHVHIGVAVALDEGLVVPVLRHANAKGFGAIAQEVKEYVQRARDRKLQPEDFEGNTFTISNLGMFGIEEFTAILNPPEACIMAVGAIKETVQIEEGELVATNVMKVTMSCDHRVVDGAMGAKFLQTFKQLLEEPVRLLA